MRRGQRDGLLENFNKLDTFQKRRLEDLRQCSIGNKEHALERLERTDVEPLELSEKTRCGIVHLVPGLVIPGGRIRGQDCQ
jgi:hypothetical protein